MIKTLELLRFDAYVYIMKLNSKESIKAGRSLLDAYGSWGAVRAAATRGPDGKLNVPAKPPRAKRPPKKMAG